MSILIISLKNYTSCKIDVYSYIYTCTAHNIATSGHRYTLANSPTVKPKKVTFLAMCIVTQAVSNVTIAL